MLRADVALIEKFVSALFAHADEDTWISLRAFDQTRRDVPPTFIRPVKVDKGFHKVVAAAARAAEDAGNNAHPVVFAPPIATFSNPDRARTIDLANGVALSVEIDEGDTNAASQRLSGILGPPTIVVLSGGEWVNEETGECFPKIHLHWRLSEPTRDPEDHEKLREARNLAALLVGADPTGKPVCHPLRWPGSWNRKAGTPRMAGITEFNIGSEIHLVEALDRLQGAVELAGLRHAGIASKDVPKQAGVPQADIALVTAAMHHIPNLDVHYDDWVRIGYAVHGATGGSPEGYELWSKWSQKSGKHDDAETLVTWTRICSSPPTKIGAGSLFYLAAQHGWARPKREQPPPTDSEEEYGTTRGAASGNGTADSAHTDPEPTILAATPLADLDLDHIPPRRWIYGRELIRGFVSVLGSPGGVGKTAFTMAVGFSVAAGRSLLAPGDGVPDHKTVHKTGAVWFYNLEDPADEMKRRVKATIMHHKVPLALVAERVFVDSARDRPLIVATQDDSGRMTATPDVPRLVAELKRRNISVLVVDPFKRSHTAEENDNGDMDFVMSLWSQVAHDADCAVWLVHHFRKGGTGGDAESFRGAVAISGAARVMSTLSPMSPEEADKLGVPKDKRRLHVRLDNAKLNLAPAADTAEWYRLASVRLGNGDDEYPDGDSVQACEAWTATTAWEGLPWDAVLRCLEQIDAGPTPGEKYAIARQSKDRWAGRVVMQVTNKTEGQAAAILKLWGDNGVLETGVYHSPEYRRETTCVSVNRKKLAEMERAAAPPVDG